MSHKKIDWLTKLYNEIYLEEQYSKYLKKYKNTKFIMIDFKKFKEINDVFGHDMGDKYLILFADILKSIFDTSLVIRLHGDEFCILTHDDEKEIIKKFDFCNKKIELTFETGKIPKKFKFNAGIVNAEKDIDITREKADYMMYYAKKNNIDYQNFIDEIWKIKEDKDIYLNNIENDMQNDKFSYYQKKICNLNKETSIYEILVYDSFGNSIYDLNNYTILKESTLLRKLDIYNLEYLLSHLVKDTKEKILINIDYKSLITKHNFLNYLKTLIDIKKINTCNIILSINIKDIVMENYQVLIDIINKLKNMKFSICLDNYSNMTVDYLWEHIKIDYIRLDNDYLRNLLNNSKSEALLISKIKLFNELSNVKAIFNYINECESVNVLLSKLDNDEILLSGKYLIKEELLECDKV